MPLSADRARSSSEEVVRLTSKVFEGHKSLSIAQGDRHARSRRAIARVNPHDRKLPFSRAGNDGGGTAPPSRILSRLPRAASVRPRLLTEYLSCSTQSRRLPRMLPVEKTRSAFQRLEQLDR